MSAPHLTLSSVVHVRPENLACEVSGEAVILHPEQGIYFGLDPVGTRIWQLLQAPRTVAEILRILLEEYDVEPERCQGDLLALLSAMLKQALITLEVDPPAVSVEGASDERHEAPE